MTTWTLLVHNPIVRGAAMGALGAASADIAAFRSWKSFHDAATYQWSIAAFRWFQGAAVGVLTSAGWSAVIS